MKLVSKLSMTLAFSFALIFAGALLLIARQEREFADTQALRHSEQLGQAIASSLAQVLEDRGEAETRALLREIDADDPRIEVRWLSLDEPAQSDEAFLALLGEHERRQIVRGHHVERLDPDDDSMMVTLVPVPAPEGSRAAIVVSRSLEFRNTHLRRLLLGLALTTLAALCGALLVTHLVGRWLIGRPMQRFADWAQAVGSGRLDARLELEGRDELATMARTMNDMTQRLVVALREREEAQALAMQHAERLSMIGQLASGVVHEIRTPLQVIAMRSELLARAPDDAEMAVTTAAVVREQVERIERMASDVLGFARKGLPRRERVDLREIAEQSLSLLRLVGTEQPIEMVVEAPAGETPLVVSVDASQLRQVVSNLVLNAVQAMPEGGRIVVRVAGEPVVTADEATRFVRLEVSDEGPGIAPEVLPRLFEPFFTTKSEGKGTGLGLAISKGIVEEHGGTIEVDSEAGRGTTFRIRLPAS